MELTDKKWKAFKVSKLFNIQPCKCGNASALEDGDDVFYRGAKKAENGVMRKVKRDEALVSKGNCIMFICDGDGSCGYTNYIADDFIGSTTTAVGYNDHLNPTIGAFITSILDMQKYKYSHARKYRTSLPNELIMLPVDDNGNPDWEWIEQYMASLEADLDTQVEDIMEIADGDKDVIKTFADKVEISNFKAWLNDNANMNADNQMSLDDTKWGLFHLYDFSKISMGNKMDYSKMHTDNPSVNFVGRSANDNGIKSPVDLVKVQNEDGSISIIEPYKAGSITIALGGSIGSTYVQPKDFYTSQNVAVLEMPDISDGAKWFVCAMVKKECELKYCAFGRELNSHLRTDFTIPLPLDDNGNPDWEWIERYMKSLPYSNKEQIGA